MIPSGYLIKWMVLDVHIINEIDQICQKYGREVLGINDNRVKDICYNFS